jgi:hypothetical protein
MPKKAPGDSMNPSPFKGELKAEPLKLVLGVNLSSGVEVMFLLKFVLEMSARTFADRERSRRGLFVDLFSGDPLPGMERKFVSLKISKSALKSWNM